MTEQVASIAPRKSRGRAAAKLVVDVLLNTFTTLLALSFMFPFVWTVSSALKTGWEVIAFPPKLMPKAPQWGNFYEAWTSADFASFFKNSAIVTILSLVGVVVSSFLAAYGFARFRFRGREFVFLLCLSGMMMPIYVTIIPLFTLFRSLHWINTLKPLIVPHFFGSAFSIFLLRQFIMSIPLDFDESALLDGASRMTILLRILAPNCKPALATVAIFTFMATWNEFLTPLIFLDTQKKFTLPLGLWFLRSYADDPSQPTEHLLMAASLITTLPVLLVFVSAQKYFIEGVVMSGIKG